MFERFTSELKRLRERAGHSQKDLALTVHVSQGHLSDLERGRKRVTGDLAKRLDSALDAQGQLVRLWDELRNNEFTSWFLDVLEVEQRATEIHTYQPTVVPGLLQTEYYAYAQVDPGPDRDAVVNGRLNRQSILERVRFVAVLDETILRRPVGGWEVLSCQLAAILDSAATIQVVPHDATVPPSEPFIVYKQDNRDVVYVENRISGTARDDLATVRMYNGILSEFRGVALPPGESRSLIRKVRSDIDVEKRL